MAKSPQQQFEKDIRRDLTLALLTRADYAGETIRALLFAAAGGAAGFLLSQQPPPDFSIKRHGLSLVLFLSSALIVIISWANSKDKGDRKIQCCSQSRGPRIPKISGRPYATLVEQ